MYIYIHTRAFAYIYTIAYIHTYTYTISIFPSFPHLHPHIAQVPRSHRLAAEDWAGRTAPSTKSASSSLESSVPSRGSAMDPPSRMDGFWSAIGREKTQKKLSPSVKKWVLSGWKIQPIILEANDGWFTEFRSQLGDFLLFKLLQVLCEPWVAHPGWEEWVKPWCTPWFILANYGFSWLTIFNSMLTGDICLTMVHLVHLDYNHILTNHETNCYMTIVHGRYSTDELRESHKISTTRCMGKHMEVSWVIGVPPVIIHL